MKHTKRLKPVLPSLREKKRYLAFEVITENATTSREAGNAITEAVLNLSGDLGLAKASVLMLHDKYANNKGIIRVNRKEVPVIKAALTLQRTVGEQPAIIRSLGVSGMLNKTITKYLTA